MVYTDYVSIENAVLHQVGNKLNEDEIVFSKSPLAVDEKVKKILINYFFSAFKYDEFYRFYHEVDLSYNEACSYISKIFNDPDAIYEQSVNLAKHLYNHSEHPKIKTGEFYVIYFKDCVLNDKTVDAVGIFKSENKDTFLEIEQVNNAFYIESHRGININKMDKGAIIFNTGEADGYSISIIDNINKGNDARYWKDDFLKVKPVENEFHQTNQFMGITKQFITKELKESTEITRADQIDLLNRSVDYFKSHEQFDKSDFENEVLKDEYVIDSFNGFNDVYKQEHEVAFSDNFEISSQAVKKQARAFKSVLKLDKNFHIYIHGDRDLIEQGVDNNGRKFYKIYFDEES
jgi:hypothetical protein